MATHFDPQPNDDAADQAPCGTWLGDSSELSGNWAHVDCRLCLKRKPKIMAAHSMEESDIIEQMGDMAAYFRRNSGDSNER